MMNVKATSEDLHEKVTMMQSRNANNFFAIGAREYLNRVLAAMKKFEWKPRKNCWVLVTNQDYVPSCFNCSGYEIYLVYPVSSDNRSVPNYKDNRVRIMC